MYVPLHEYMLIRKGGLTHGFVVEFASEEDREYYLTKDPAHLEFGKTNSSKWDGVTVLDYEKGVY